MQQRMPAFEVSHRHVERATRTGHFVAVGWTNFSSVSSDNRDLGVHHGVCEGVPDALSSPRTR